MHYNKHHGDLKCFVFIEKTAEIKIGIFLSYGTSSSNIIIIVITIITVINSSSCLVNRALLFYLTFQVRKTSLHC